MLAELEAKEAEMGQSKPPAHDAMDIITQNMNETDRNNLNAQINLEKDEADKIFTEDDMQFENYDNLLDKKIPVDPQLVKEYKLKLGIIDRADMEVDKPKSIQEFQDVIKNQQGAVKRMKKEDKIDNPESKNKSDYVDYLRNTSSNELDSIDMNNIKESKSDESKSNLIKIDESVKKKPKPVKKNIQIKEVTDEDLEINKINLNKNSENININENNNEKSDSIKESKQEKTIYINNQTKSNKDTNQSTDSNKFEIDLIKDE